MSFSVRIGGAPQKNAACLLLASIVGRSVQSKKQFGQRYSSRPLATQFTQALFLTSSHHDGGSVLDENPFRSFTKAELRKMEAIAAKERERQEAEERAHERRLAAMGGEAAPDNAAST